MFLDVLDPKSDSTLCADLLDATNSLMTLMQSFNKVTSKWSGYCSPERRMGWVMYFNAHVYRVHMFGYPDCLGITATFYLA